MVSFFSFPDNPLWMIPFECIEAYDAFFTKERYALHALEQAGLCNLHYLPMYCVPEMHHPIELTPEETRRYAAPLSFVAPGLVTVSADREGYNGAQLPVTVTVNTYAMDNVNITTSLWLTILSWM